ncbi:ferredoxin family protein [Methanothermobacter tenebrarum]|uniref:Ferredoxin n=1 Tax=Methanothermobacter tenebrarum TaxID=680118 RepID=A0A328P9K8_9EURY|nr:ferredoxin family protein [Methanothermobacter tenebrarum]NPV65042.1 ferredoxin family protein [Methanobacteriaceae archaeon]RAO79278.1 ferredoxin [Methanothermobacter tenebrarum]
MIHINPELCKGCNICIEFCPEKVYKESDTLNKRGVYVPVPEHEDKCKKCKICILLCPDQAIAVDENG